MASKPSSRSDFRFAIVCALPIEYDAVHESLDEVWPDLSKMGVLGDHNRYVAGSMGDIPVVLTLLPGMGKANAAGCATSLRSSFVNIKYALLVGICGAAPKNGDAEILLGDVIIGKYVVQYDFGRQYPDEFKLKNRVEDTLGRPNKEIRILTALWGTRAENNKLKSQAAQFLLQLQEKLVDTEDYGLYDYAGVANDKLFESGYRHKHHDPVVCPTCRECSDSKEPVCPEALDLTCADLQCSDEKVVQRVRQQRKRKFGEQAIATAQGPAIHIGGIASADTVMKSGLHRDKICEKESVIAFEMEGTGIWDEIPCLIVKGVCDYADSHKNKAWQNYASATAASASKAILKGFFEAYQTEVDKSNQDFHFIPFLRNEYFVGRDEVITKLHELLFTHGTRRVALVGLGGIGKTQVALHLAHNTREKMTGVFVVWLPAFSMAGYELSCSELVKKLQIPREKDDDPKQLIKDYLESHGSGNWLFILDNADDEKILFGTPGQDSGIYSYLPQNKNGRILLTTRYRKIAVQVARNHVVNLLQLPPNEAHALFHKSLPNPDGIKNEDAITQLLETLCYLPLAISQATAYLDIHQITIEMYLNLCQNSRKDFAELLETGFNDDTYYRESQSAVASTWLISFKQISDNYPGAAQLLSFISWIEPKAIPLSILPRVGSEQEQIMAIGILKGYGFLSIRESNETVDMHSLVHFVMQKHLHGPDTEGIEIDKLLSHFEVVFPSHKWENRCLWRQYMPHALRVYRQFQTKNYMKNSILGYYIGRCLLRDGQDQEALVILESVVALQRTLAEDHPDLLNSQHVLAMVYINNKQLKEAASLLEHITTILQITSAEDHPDLLNSQHVLAIVYRDNGQLKEAALLLEHIMTIRRRTFPEDHPDQLASQHVLGMVYHDNKQLKEAASLLEHVTTIRQRTLADDHPDLLNSQHELAVIYHHSGQTNKAVNVMKDVVSIRRKAARDNDPDRLASEKWFEIILSADSSTNKDVLS